MAILSRKGLRSQARPKPRWKRVLTARPTELLSPPPGSRLATPSIARHRFVPTEADVAWWAANSRANSLANGEGRNVLARRVRSIATRWRSPAERYTAETAELHLEPLGSAFLGHDD